VSAWAWMKRVVEVVLLWVWRVLSFLWYLLKRIVVYASEPIFYSILATSQHYAERLEWQHASQFEMMSQGGQANAKVVGAEYYSIGGRQ
jgi:hypothetical protein